MQGWGDACTRGAAALLAGAVLLALPATTSADTIGKLRAKSAALSSRTHAALLDLYALDSALGRARAGLASVRAREAALQRARAAAKLRLGIARRSLVLAQRRLGDQLRLLYEEGEPDALAIMLGSRSLDEAIEGLNSVRSAARTTQSIVEQARSTRQRVAALVQSLDSRAAELRQLARAAVASAAALEQAQAERATYVVRLRREQRLADAEITSLEAKARAAQAKARAATRAAGAGRSFVEATELLPWESPPEPVQLLRPATGEPTLIVVATGYSLAGTTATGLPVGPGIVAVDPSVIPLGTRMSIPGYGEGVAADTGPGISGAMIDLWFPTFEEAGVWGRRTLTITLY